MDGSGGQDMLSQQRMLQSYMDNLFGPQQQQNGNNPGAGPAGPGGGGIMPGIQMPQQQQQQAMHPGVPAIFQNAQRYQANDGAPGNGYGQQQQQQAFQPNNAQQQQQHLWQQQLSQQQQQQQQAQAQAQRPIFPATTSGSNQSGQMTQAEIQAMLTSLGQQSQSTLPSNNNNAGMPGNNSTPQPQFAMNQFLQQQQANPAAYNAQLQAAIQHMQQQQQGHLTSSTPPPPNNAAAQAAALLMAQQQQQQAALASGNMNGGVVGNMLQQGGQIDPAILMKLRQSGMNLTPEQHVLLSTRMLRRGGIADGPQQGGQQQQQAPPIQGSPQQQQQHLLQQQLQRQLPTASLPLGLSNLQPALPNQTPQGQPQNLFPPPLPQQQQQQAGGFPSSIPLNVLQEFTTISEQLRTYTTTEQHLAMCLSQNLHIPKQLSGNQNNQQQQNQSPQPLTQQTRMQIEKTLEHTRRLLGNARETLARLEMEYGGKENIINHLKAFAAQKHARQNQASQQQQQQQQMPPQQQQQIPPQNQNQNQNQNQQQQQQAISALVNRGQMRTPVNGMQAQQQSQQQQPTPPQLHRLPTNSSQLTLQQQQQQQSTPQQMQARVLATIGQSSTPLQNQQQQQNNNASQQQGGLMSPNPLSRNMSMAQGASPSLNAIGLPGANTVLPNSQQNRPPNQQNPSSQSIPTTSNPPLPNGGNNPAALAQHQQFLRNQAGHVNEEILKTLAAAGPSTFMKALFDTMLKRGTPIKNTPRVDGSEIDLVKLYRLVQQRGGCAVVRQSGLWRTIALEHGLNVDADSSQRISDQLSNVYTEFLEPFEEIQRKAAMANYQKHHIQQVQAQAAANRQQQQQQMQQQQNQQDGQGQGQGIVRQPSPMQQQPQNGNQMTNQQFQQHTQSQQQYLQNMQHLQQQAQQQHAVNMQQQQQLQQQQQQQQQQNGGNQPFIPPQPQQQQVLQVAAQQSDNRQSSPAMIMQHLPPANQPQGHQRTMSQSSSNQQSMTPNMGQKQLQPGQKLNNLPSPEELERAKAEINAMQAGIASKKAQYDPISMPDPAEQERFIAAAKNMAPMVDKVMDLLAVYLAISQQVEGSRRLLVMMSMFRDQLPLLEQRQFILRVSDLEKLKVQMQRCWSFVHSTAAGQFNQQNPAASSAENGQNNNSNSNANVQQQAASQQAQQPSNGSQAGSMDPAAFSAALKAGIKIEDLKPPAPKHRRTNSAAGTPSAAGTSPAVATNVTGGTGATYASPIAVDSPSPAKTDNKPLSALPTRKASQTGNSPAATNKAGAARKGKSKVGATPSSDTTGATPLMINSLQLAPASMQSSVPSEQQQASLKRKRELEDAQKDPVGFSKRILASYLDTQNGSSRVDESSDALTAELLSFLNEDMMESDQPEPKADVSSSTASKASPSKDDQSISIFLADTPASNKWPYDSMSIAETPELGHLDDPTKTSPPDHDSIATPADSGSHPNLHPYTSSTTPFSTSATSSQSVSSFSKALSAPSSSFTQNLLSSFDEEYNKMFGMSTPTLAPAADPNTMNWNWETGPVFPATKA